MLELRWRQVSPKNRQLPLPTQLPEELKRERRRRVNDMFNIIWNGLKNEFGLDVMSNIIIDMRGLVSHFEQDYFVDKNAKNAAIDAIIEILQQHKDQ